MATVESTPTPEQEQKPSVQLQNADELQKVFNSFDTNGDGLISAAELSGVLRALGSAHASADIAAVMEDLDADRDGFISLAEFASFCRAPSPDGGASELRDAFELYDQDRNGLISAAELHLVLTRLGIPCSAADCERMIAPVDGDGDGNVNFEEFQKMMTNTTTKNTPSA